MDILRQIAINMKPIMAAIAATLVRSLSAKTMGSSCMRPWNADIHIQLTQNSKAAKTPHSAERWL